MKHDFAFKIKAVRLAEETGIEAASEQLSVSKLTLEAWINMYSGENLYRKACEYSVTHGIKETADILGVSERTFYRIRNEYGKRKEKKDSRKRYKDSYKKKVAEMSAKLGTKETAKVLGTDIYKVYRARRDMSATNPNKQDNIRWDFIEDGGFKTSDICECCDISRSALSTYASKEKTSDTYRRFVTAMIAYKMFKNGRIDETLFENYWTKCRDAQRDT